ncbi:molybdopterin-dependent oxidoreductase [Paracoccus sp. (in: a-proteobacteria)]|uniref:molybdopterin-dependent oxidoreductase n=1 Tax=Paracoccus sp. TaxID=267 RepID=UPI003A8A46AB
MDNIRRVPHCSHWGAYTLLVQGDRIVGVEPFADDPAPSPIIHSVREWANPERRVLQPLVREGWLRAREGSDRTARGSDKFVAIGWDEVNALVAGEITRVARDHGNASIFAGSYGWTSCGRFHHAPSQLKRLLNLIGGYTGHVDTYSTAAGPVILRHTLGDDGACGGDVNSLDTIAGHTETLVVFGAMSPRTEQNEAGGIARHRLAQHLRRLADRGVRVVLVSPLRDDLPDWLGAEWWPIRPNTDTALMLGLAGEIAKAGRQARDFLTRCTSGADGFLAYLGGATDGVTKDAAWAAGITGLDAGQIAALARRMVETRSMMTVSWSLQRAHHGEQPYWAALALACVIGQIGLPGGGVGFGYASLGGVGAPLNRGRSVGLSQFARQTRPIRSFIPVARISDLLLNPGGSFTYEGHEHRYPDTRLVYWAGGNPFHHHQDLNRLARAWTRPETIIVQDPVFTATAQRADIILPANTSIERNDIAGNKRSDAILAMHRAIAPLGQSRSDFDIMNDLAAHLGVAEAFNEGRNEMGWLRHLYNISRMDAETRLGHRMPEFDQFWARGHADMPVQENYVHLRKFRNDPEGHRLATESGRIVLYSQKLALLDYGDCKAHPAWIEPAEWLGKAGGDGRFHLISHQPQGRLHSQLETGKASVAERRNGREQARMHPEDARAHGIADGQTIRLSNSRGQCRATATLCDGVRRGVIVLPTGGRFLPDDMGCDISGNPNVLTPDIGSSAFGQGCSAHTCLVSVTSDNRPPEDALKAGLRLTRELLPDFSG